MKINLLSLSSSSVESCIHILNQFKHWSKVWSIPALVDKIHYNHLELNNYNWWECRMTKRMTNSCTLLIYTPVINGDVKTDELQSCKTVLNFFLINFKARILRFWSKSHLLSLWSFRSQESQKIKEISKILSAASIPSLLLYHWALFACCSKPSLVCLFVCWWVSCITDDPGRFFFGRE